MKKLIKSVKRLIAPLLIVALAIPMVYIPGTAVAATPITIVSVQLHGGTGSGPHPGEPVDRLPATGPSFVDFYDYDAGNHSVEMNWWTACDLGQYPGGCTNAGTVVQEPDPGFGGWAQFRLGNFTYNAVGVYPAQIVMTNLSTGLVSTFDFVVEVAERITVILDAPFPSDVEAGETVTVTGSFQPLWATGDFVTRNAYMSLGEIGDFELEGSCTIAGNNFSCSVAIPNDPGVIGVSGIPQITLNTYDAFWLGGEPWWLQYPKRNEYTFSYGSAPLTIHTPTLSTVGNVSVDFTSVDAWHDQPYIDVVTQVGGNPKAGFKFVPGNTFYSITPVSDLQYTMPAEVCLTWVEGTVGNESGIELNHWEYVPAKGKFDWVNITSAGYPDTVNNKVCGITNSFSDFALMVPVPNVAPIVGSVSAPLDPQVVGTVVNATASFTDENEGDTHTAVWDWGNGSTSAGTVGAGTVIGSYTYATPGVYTVKVTVTDNGGLEGLLEATNFVVVYDPSGGFVTGGGWINSPVGAYVADGSLMGKANFGFNSKYQNGANVPSGRTEFSFKVGNLNFKSTSYEWLVVAGSQAKFKGVGTINGTGNYGFMLTAKDGSPDTFRIKIWDKDNGDAVVYDNKISDPDNSYAGTSLGGGNIVVHNN